jgi:transposase
MTLSILSPQERALLEEFASCTRKAKALRRAQALLWLDQDESLAAVATRLAVTRQTVYNWVKHFRARRPAALGERLADGLRSGRPPTVKARIDPVLEAVLPQDPRALGYRSTVWTAPLLTQYLRDAHDLTVSRQSVSLALARLDVRWKRPRHRLAHRSPTWRQEKGGSNGDSEGVPALSC